ncbi:MAG: DNA recombination protein RmuC [Acidimicrobiia bacterium]|nr:DNA recombination protein RmuC [Acidimicrobiia bacterium]
MELILPLAAALVAALVATLVTRHSLARHARAQEGAEQKMRDAFQSVAADALHTNRAAFLDLAKESFAGFHKPIADTLKRVDERLTESEQARASAFATLTEQLRTLDTTATTLSRALRTPHVRGQWGEMQLRRVVEIAGMLEWCDFEQQPSLIGDSGRLRPDMVVHLPGGKRIVVDSKAPMEAFLDAQECADEAGRAVKLRAHARQVREHVNRLGAKSYWEALEGSPDLVVLFLPGETFFSAALQHDLKLVEEALQQRVLLASPITLIALLTTVAHAWRQEALVENYREVAQLGKEFYERLARFTGHLDEVRKKLDGAVQAYNEAVGSLESRVLVSARRLKELKVTTAEELPSPELIDARPRGMLKQPDLNLK